MPRLVLGGIVLLIQTMAIAVCTASPPTLDTDLPLAAWTFRANWSFEPDLHGTSVLPRLSCAFGALSLVALDHNPAVERSLLTPAQLATPRLFPCQPVLNQSQCHVTVVWHVQCILPCPQFCPQPVTLNLSHHVVCHQHGFCQSQIKPPALLPLWVYSAVATASTALGDNTLSCQPPSNLVNLGLGALGLLVLGGWCYLRTGILDVVGESAVTTTAPPPMDSAAYEARITAEVSEDTKHYIARPTNKFNIYALSEDSVSDSVSDSEAEETRPKPRVRPQLLA